MNRPYLSVLLFNLPLILFTAHLMVLLKEKDRRLKVSENQCSIFPFNLIGHI